MESMVCVLLQSELRFLSMVEWFSWGFVCFVSGFLWFDFFLLVFKYTRQLIAVRPPLQHMLRRGVHLLSFTIPRGTLGLCQWRVMSLVKSGTPLLAVVQFVAYI